MASEKVTQIDVAAVQHKLDNIFSLCALISTAPPSSGDDMRNVAGVAMNLTWELQQQLRGGQA